MLTGAISNEMSFEATRVGAASETRRAFFRTRARSGHRQVISRNERLRVKPPTGAWSINLHREAFDNLLCLYLDQ